MTSLETAQCIVAIIHSYSDDEETVMRRIIDLLAETNEFLIEDVAHYAVSLLAARSTTKAT